MVYCNTFDILDKSIRGYQSVKIFYDEYNYLIYIFGNIAILNKTIENKNYILIPNFHFKLLDHIKIHLKIYLLSLH